MNKNTKFILKPITDIIKEAITASSGIGGGIETYPLCDYIMQSVFMKMTGFQEQKMKCICWELATNDYEYRYEFTKNKLGECSSYKDKNKIYKDIIECIKKHNNNFSFQINKYSKLKAICRYIKSIFSNTNISIWAQSEYIKFNDILTQPNIATSLGDNSVIFDKREDDDMNSNNEVRKIYNYLYRHRNKCAHNTQSYQQNLPTLKTLIDNNYQYENYFIRFAILILIDKIFIELYKKYLDVLD